MGRLGSGTGGFLLSDVWFIHRLYVLISAVIAREWGEVGGRVGRAPAMRREVRLSPGDGRGKQSMSAGNAWDLGILLEGVDQRNDGARMEGKVRVQDEHVGGVSAHVGYALQYIVDLLRVVPREPGDAYLDGKVRVGVLVNGERGRGAGGVRRRELYPPLSISSISDV